MSTASQVPIRVPKAAELVASSLRRQIISGELREGDALPSEAALMKQFKVSRPTLREAYRILESESLIHVRRGARGGAMVQLPNGDVAARYAGYVLEYRGTTMSDVYLARAELEPPLARMMAARATKRDLKRLQAVLDAGDAATGDPELFVQRDIDFHLAVAQFAGNETMRVMLDMLYHIVMTARRRYVAEGKAEGGERLLAEHRAVQRTHQRLLDLVKDGDVEGAQTWWRRHLDEVTRHYLARPVAKTVVETMDQ